MSAAAGAARKGRPPKPSRRDDIDGATFPATHRRALTPTGSTHRCHTPDSASLDSRVRHRESDCCGRPLPIRSPVQNAGARDRQSGRGSPGEDRYPGVRCHNGHGHRVHIRAIPHETCGNLGCRQLLSSGPIELAHDTPTKCRAQEVGADRLSRLKSADVRARPQAGAADEPTDQGGRRPPHAASRGAMRVPEPPAITLNPWASRTREPSAPSVRHLSGHDDGPPSCASPAPLSLS
jgi:hypothetical protein